jgi:hypothetical protein
VRWFTPFTQPPTKRKKQLQLPGTAADRELAIAQSKEVRRGIDFLETRPEIDMDQGRLFLIQFDGKDWQPLEPAAAIRHPPTH